MPSRNVEIKARATDFARQQQLAEALSDSAPTRIVQEDTYLNVSSGRLKLRVFEDGTGELIHYERPDTPSPKESRYIQYELPRPAALKEALTRGLGIRAVVRKTRTLYMAGQTRIHFDEVEGLGRFIELEVVLRDSDSEAMGTEIAHNLMRQLMIQDDDLIAEGYLDLLDRRISEQS